MLVLIKSAAVGADLETATTSNLNHNLTETKGFSNYLHDGVLNCHHFFQPGDASIFP
jgi:hypothetical protein